MGTRRQAREHALKILYSIDVGGQSVEEAIRNYWALYEPGAEGREFAELLVRGTAGRLEEIDGSLQRVSMHWRLTRMNSVDRNILRLAVFELFHVGDVPKRVTLNEAIEIAKRYGAADSSAFVNGILDKLATEADENAGD